MSRKLTSLFRPRPRDAGKGAKASAEGQGLYVQLLYFRVAPGKVVVGDAGPHVMGMMEPDVPRGPLQERGSL